MIFTKESRNKLLQKIKELEQKVVEAEQTIEAIKYDQVDALVISTDNGDQIFTLEGADRPYRIFLEQMNEGAITVARDGTILYSNKSFADLLQIPLEGIIGSNLLNHTEAQDIKKLTSLISQKENHAKVEINFTRQDKTNISLYLSMTELHIDGIKPVLCLIATDLTEKKKSEEIVAAEKLARSILEQAAEAIVVCDENMIIIRANQAAENLAGEPVLFKTFDSVYPLLDENKAGKSIFDLVRNKQTRMAEAAILKEEGEKINLILNIGQLSGQQNNTLGYVINLTNITKHINAEEQLSASLKEKTVLLKEIHHRVKNNLQIISSLLALQAANIKEESLLGVLGECRNRISSMALIHQKLYESKSFSSISIPEYLRELVISLSSTYQLRNCRVDLDIPPEDIHLTIESAIPLGLIMNELVTNTFKHAFVKKERGEIKISIRELNSKCFEIIVADTGSGIPAEIDFYNPETLGLQLVHTLIIQLNGKIRLLPYGGTMIKMDIPKE